MDAYGKFYDPYYNEHDPGDAEASYEPPAWTPAQTAGPPWAPPPGTANPYSGYAPAPARGPPPGRGAPRAPPKRKVYKLYDPDDAEASYEPPAGWPSWTPARTAEPLGAPPPGTANPCNGHAPAPARRQPYEPAHGEYGEYDPGGAGASHEAPARGPPWTPGRWVPRVPPPGAAIHVGGLYAGVDAREILKKFQTVRRFVRPGLPLPHGLLARLRELLHQRGRGARATNDERCLHLRQTGPGHVGTTKRTVAGRRDATVGRGQPPSHETRAQSGARTRRRNSVRG